MSAHDDTHGHGHGLAHVAEKKVLLATIATLLFLTFATVAATWWDFGEEVNLALGMVIATTKATLVVTFFMHLKYDKRFHRMALVTALLFATLFVGICLMDRSTYEADVIWNADQPPQNP